MNIEWVKLIGGVFALGYPILQAYLRGKGYNLPDMGDFSAKTQMLGGALLASAKNPLKKSDAQ